MLQGSTAFAIALYRQLAEAKGNLFFSPQSISTAMAMVAAGARGETLAELESVLHLPLIVLCSGIVFAYGYAHDWYGPPNQLGPQGLDLGHGAGRLAG